MTELKTPKELKEGRVAGLKAYSEGLKVIAYQLKNLSPEEASGRVLDLVDEIEAISSQFLEVALNLEEDPLPRIIGSNFQTGWEGQPEDSLNWHLDILPLFKN